MLEIKRDIFTGREDRRFFTIEEIKDYNFSSFKELDNSPIKSFLKDLDFIKLGKTKGKIEDNTEIFISGIEIDDSVFRGGKEFNQAVTKLDRFESRIA